MSVGRTIELRMAERILHKAARDYADLTDGLDSWPARGDESILAAGARLRLAAKSWRRAERDAVSVAEQAEKC